MSAEEVAEVWRGHFTYFEIPEPHPMQFRLERTSDRLAGRGSDEVGEFTIVGVPGRNSGSWSITKQYIGKHEVRYEATETGEGMVGRWFLQGTCGGAFAFWPGTSETPPSKLLSDVPKVEVLPVRIRNLLVLLDWSLFLAGLLGLVFYAALSTTRKRYYIAFIVFGVYVWLSAPFQKWVVRRILRNRLGVFGAAVNSWRIGAPIGWKTPVTTSSVVVAILTVAGMLVALWFFHMKR